MKSNSLIVRHRELSGFEGLNPRSLNPKLAELLDRGAYILLVSRKPLRVGTPWRKSTMGTLRGEQIIAQSFKREGVDTIFFMMGGPTGGTAGACLDIGMKGIYVRHEQAAAMMAHAYARVTGKPGICIAPMGPGVANLVTGLGNAWADASPVIAIGGSAPMRGWTLDTFQEMDQVPMMKPIVKAAYRVDLGYRIPEYISIAFRGALDGVSRGRRDPCDRRACELDALLPARATFLAGREVHQRQCRWARNRP